MSHTARPVPVADVIAQQGLVGEAERVENGQSVLLVADEFHHDLGEGRLQRMDERGAWDARRAGSRRCGPTSPAAARP
jgi:hypothetical protein